jgi:hypothetical protein
MWKKYQIENFAIKSKRLPINEGTEPTNANTINQFEDVFNSMKSLPLHWIATSTPSGIEENSNRQCRMEERTFWKNN